MCESAAVFPTGAAGKALLMQSLGITKLGSETLRSLRKEEKMRVENVAKKSSKKFKAGRKKLRLKKKENQEIQAKLHISQLLLGYWLNQKLGVVQRKNREGKVVEIQKKKN